MGVGEILALPRDYLFDVLFFPRDDCGVPLFPQEKGESPGEYLYGLAVARGLPHPHALAWARGQQRPRKRGR